MTQCMRIAALAERWDCSAGKVRAMIRAGDLPVLRLGTMLRIPVAAIIAFEAQCEQQTAPDSAVLPGATPGTSITPAVASLRAARIAQARKRS
jgi:Helix-turn-helix domain